MSTEPVQGQWFGTPAGDGGVVVVNGRTRVETRDGHRVVTVDGVVVHHYVVGDRMAEAYAMVLLVECGYADQDDTARSFGCASRTLRRYADRFAAGGLAALGRPRGRPRRENAGEEAPEGARDSTILRMKAKGASNRAVGRHLGVDERGVRRRLARLGWKSASTQGVCFEDDEASDDAPGTAAREESGGAAGRTPGPSEQKGRASASQDPLDRSMDRLMAALGLLDDADPLFARAASVPRAGVLLAVPGLLDSGLLSIARTLYKSLAPAFYGLRTTLVAFVLLALLRIQRAEALKEHDPVDLGRILGLDRAPEVKTLRRKLSRLAGYERAERLGRELACRRVDQRGKTLGFLYVDGHVRVYHGKHAIPKAHVTQMRTALPATTDYWINDQRGDPLLMMTSDANAHMTHVLLPVLDSVRAMIGPKRRCTIVFDRGGWSPELFVAILARGFDLLTYRKGRVPLIDEKEFVECRARPDGRPVRYRLNDQEVAFLKGRLQLRQVTRLNDTGHQTPILGSRRDLRPAVIAYRMFGRWRQENFFKYMGEEYHFDALCDYQVEPDDPTRSVPNPAWRALKRKWAAARADLAELESRYGKAAMDNPERKRPTTRGMKIALGKLGRQIRLAREQVAHLRREREGLAQRIPVSQVQPGEPVVRLARERKHLSDILKMVAYQVESDLLALLRPHYARIDDEGRTLVQTALQSSASLEPRPKELRVTLAPLSSPHRSKAIAALCRALNKRRARFPGTDLRMHFGVAEA